MPHAQCHTPHAPAHTQSSATTTPATGFLSAAAPARSWAWLSASLLPLHQHPPLFGAVGACAELARHLACQLVERELLVVLDHKVSGRRLLQIAYAPCPRKQIDNFGCPQRGLFRSPLVQRAATCSVQNRLPQSLLEPASQTRVSPVSAYALLLPSLRLHGTWSMDNRSSGSHRPHLGSSLLFGPPFRRRRKRACHRLHFGNLLLDDTQMLLVRLRSQAHVKVTSKLMQPARARLEGSGYRVAAHLLDGLLHHDA